MLLNSAAFDDALSAFGICVTLFVIRSASIPDIHMSLNDCRTAALSFCAPVVCADISLTVMASWSPIVLTPAFRFRSAAHSSSSVNGLLQILSRSDLADTEADAEADSETDADAGADAFADPDPGTGADTGAGAGIDAENISEDADSDADADPDADVDAGRDTDSALQIVSRTIIDSCGPT